ncbi:hypothetical protein ACOSQ4_027740 [Xanthoceras sorbifolium]
MIFTIHAPRKNRKNSDRSAEAWPHNSHYGQNKNQVCHSTSTSSKSHFLISSSTIFTMRIQSSLHLCLTLIVLVAIIQSTSCRKYANHQRVTGDQEPVAGHNLSRTKYTSMFLQSFSAMLGSADHDTNKIHHLRSVSRRKVPSGPSPIVN